MTHFFYDVDYFSDLAEFIEHNEWDEEYIKSLPDDWSIKVQGTTLEKVFVLGKEDINDFVEECLCSRYEDRFPEEPESILSKIEKAIMSGMDLDKINSAMPSLYYPNGETFSITKSDLIEWIQ